MEINPIKPNTNGLPFPGATTKTDAVKEVAPKAKNAHADAATLHQQVKDVTGPEKERLDIVMKAANMYKNVYAVSDTTFTIFKDSTGQYITRFTSLKDGTVTYIPEPGIVQFMENAREERAAMFEVEA